MGDAFGVLYFDGLWERGMREQQRDENQCGKNLGWHKKRILELSSSPSDFEMHNDGEMGVNSF